jgi:hypothetical protein
MIGPTGTVRVMVATRPVDFRNYAERRIMRSPRESDRRRRLFETVVARCMAEGPVGGEAFSVDGSIRHCHVRVFYLSTAPDSRRPI